MTTPADTHLPESIEQMLLKLAENSKLELDIVRALADGIRRVDEQMLREVRTVALQHEVRREAIFGELQELAGRLCAMPKRNILNGVAHRHPVPPSNVIENRATTGGGDWRQAAQKIDDELNEIFNSDAARH